jgi:serine/threonine protein kinase
MAAAKQPLIEAFDFKPGRVLARKYEIIKLLGGGWEGEVYQVRETATGIEHAAKFFYPQRNPKNRSLVLYARKLHKLRHCPILIKYHTQETIIFRNQPITFLVSDYVDGQLLSEFLRRQPGKRLDIFQGLHLLHALAAGIESIHHYREYHGDLHAENIIIKRYGLGFDLKLLDMFHYGAHRRENVHDDICDLIRLFYDAIGGQKHYAKHPPEVKAICCGLKRSMILKKFKTVGALRDHLENIQWDS